MAQRPKNAEPRPQPRLYLMTPALDDADVFALTLEPALKAGDVACVLLRLAAGDERSQINRIKAIASLVQQHNAALLVDGHGELIARSGADGAHLTGIDAITQGLGKLKPDWIVGAGGLELRHDAMAAAEGGVDYVMFGEPDDAGQRPGFDAVLERVAWWAEVFEAPCVAYAGAIGEIAALVEAGADFVALGDWIWNDPANIAATIAAAMPHLRLPESAA
ncbi:MAG: thiamine phosphate synthase [Pseudolabrys sp.]|nr:thiamine phosphate synthase [Pseudolabrys sp.]MDP2294351.1 thiamine phosphate synthase [Pseudolabrys sp.]